MRALLERGWFATCSLSAGSVSYLAGTSMRHIGLLMKGPVKEMRLLA